MAHPRERRNSRAAQERGVKPIAGKPGHEGDGMSQRTVTPAGSAAGLHRQLGQQPGNRPSGHGAGNPAQTPLRSVAWPGRSSGMMRRLRPAPGLRCSTRAWPARSGRRSGTSTQPGGVPGGRARARPRAVWVGAGDPDEIRPGALCSGRPHPGGRREAGRGRPRRSHTRCGSASPGGVSPAGSLPPGLLMVPLVSAGLRGRSELDVRAVAARRDHGAGAGDLVGHGVGLPGNRAVDVRTPGGTRPGRHDVLGKGIAGVRPGVDTVADVAKRDRGLRCGRGRRLLDDDGLGGGWGRPGRLAGAGAPGLPPWPGPPRRPGPCRGGRSAPRR